MKDKFLPIGTIVMLKGGTKSAMITSFCVVPNSEPGEEDIIKMYDYGGCPYPEGIENSEVAVVFNHDQIERIIYLGFESDEHKKLSELLNANYQRVFDELKKLNNDKNTSAPTQEETN